MNILDDLLTQAKSSPQEFLVVFDLDSTLFNVTHRTQAILRALSKDPDFCEQFPEESKALGEVIAHHRDWGIKKILQRSGIRSTIDFFEYVRDHWVEFFFSNEFLHNDQPYDGAVEFVNRLDELNVPIAYLTGRNHTRMHVGTVESLKNWRFPLKQIDHLIMKPNSMISDADFKVQAMDSLSTKAKRVWFFENEPVIIAKVRERHPLVNIVYVASVHSGKGLPPDDLPRISMRYDFTV